MSFLGVIILLTAVVNLVFAGIVFFHSKRDKISIFYALIAFFASLWALATLFFGDFKIAFFGHYIAGSLSYLSFFWFSVYYPERIIKSLFFPIAVTVGNFISLAIVPTSIFLGWGYGFFVIYLSFVFIATEVFMFQKYRLSADIVKVRLTYLIDGTLIAGTLGIFLNLILPWLGNSSFFNFGPIFVTASFTGMSIYTLMRYKLFNVRVVAAEAFVILLVLSLFTRLAAQGWSGVLDWAVFIFSIIFGFLLIRSVMREVKDKEKIAELARNLEKSNEELKKLDQAKSEFISIASHQLRAPLTAIKGYISLLVEGSFGVLPEKAQEPLKRSFSSAQQLVSLVSDLLNLSRIESGKIKYEFGETILADVITGALKELENVAQKSGIGVEFLPSNQNTKVRGDKSKLHEVFINLLDNAIKYSKGGSIKIGARVEGIGSSKKVIISISDNGIGISKDEIQKLFSKFGRTEESQKMRPDGMGIGLYFVKRIVEDHQGKIWVESEGIGKGSTFFVELPTFS